MKKVGFFLLMLTLVFVGQAQNKARTVFDDTEFVVEPLNAINTIGSDISPALVEGKLYFSSIPEKYFNKKTLERKNKAFYDTYEAPLDANGLISQERKLVSGFGQMYHEGPVSYCTVTGELFATLNNTIYPDTVRKMFSVENIKLRLVIMKKNNGVWTIKEEFPFNNKKFHFAHPAISQTGDTLIFSSDQNSDSFGKSDLFMAVRTKGVWSQPQNLGKLINTSGNEMFPTFLPGGLLAFASDGHTGGNGGLDIWYTRFPTIGEVKNAGSKINSTFDDFGLVITPDKSLGYFTSNNPNQGSDDIYCIRFNKTYKIFRGKVVDDFTGLPIAGSQVKLLDCNGENMVVTHADDSGNFQIEVDLKNCPTIEATKTGYEKERKDISKLDYAELRLKQQVPLLTIKIIDKESGKVLDFVKLDILKGEHEPFLLTKVDNYFNLRINKLGEYVFYVSKEGYLPERISYSATDNGSGKYSLVVPLEKMAPGKQFVLEDLYYDLDKYNIRPDAAMVLDRLITILNENPEIKIELGSHTDCRASSNYNMKLSQNRSNSVVSYLILKGIASNRLVAKGYGESQLVNKCADGVSCTEAEHQANRRTVVKILEIGN